MKVNVSLLLTAVLAVFLQSCTENEPHQEKPEQVQFRFPWMRMTPVTEGPELMNSLLVPN